MDFGAWNETTWAAAAAWATVAVYVVILVVAARQLREARTLREQESRPYVVVQFEPDLLIHFAIENMGRTVARNVRVSFDRRPETTRNYDPWNDASESGVLREGIPFLAPGGSMRFLFDSFPDRKDAGLPLVYQATVTYDSFDERRHYSDPYTLDLSLHLGVLQVEKKGLHEVATAVEKIQQTMHRWSDRGAIRAKVSSQYWNLARDRRQWEITLARRAYRDNGWKGAWDHIRQNFVRRHGLYSMDD